MPQTYPLKNPPKELTKEILRDKKVSKFTKSYMNLFKFDEKITFDIGEFHREIWEDSQKLVKLQEELDRFPG